MNRPTRPMARLATFAVIPAALLVSGIAVSTASYAAFSASSSDGTSNWDMGTVALENDAEQALFTAANLKPGSAETKCIEVTSSGSLPSAVKLYASDATQTHELGSWVTLQVSEGTGGNHGSCDGFVASGAALYEGTLTGFVSASSGYNSGVGSWQASGAAPETRTYQLTYSVSGDAPASIMGATAELAFTWEAQNL